VILLDTSFLIGAFKPGSTQDAALRAWLGEGEEIAVSVIAWCEFLCGPIESRVVDLVSRIVPRRMGFAAEDAELAASLFNRAGRRRGSLTDCMIAATALRLGASLATEDADDFRRFEPIGLVVLST
jgi:predicted nucleic acid-binding protein